jgi:hypothetical protein
MDDYHICLGYLNVFVLAPTEMHVCARVAVEVLLLRYVDIISLFSGTFGGIFSQILSGDDLIRERCIKFLTVKIKSLGHDVITKDAEDVLISECKKVLQVMTGLLQCERVLCILLLWFITNFMKGAMYVLHEGYELFLYI